MESCECKNLEYDETQGCEVCVECGHVKSQSCLVTDRVTEGYRLHTASKHFTGPPLKTETDGIQLIHQFAEVHSFDDCVQDEAVHLFRQLFQYKEFINQRAKTKMTCAVYCLYVAARHADLPLTFLMLVGGLHDAVDMNKWMFASSLVVQRVRTRVTDPPICDLVKPCLQEHLDDDVILLTKQLTEILMAECSTGVKNKPESYVKATAYIAWRAMDPKGRARCSYPHFMTEVLKQGHRYMNNVSRRVLDIFVSYLDEVPWVRQHGKMPKDKILIYYIKDIAEHRKLYMHTRSLKKHVPDYETEVRNERKRVKLLEDTEQEKVNYLKSKYNLDSEEIEEDLIPEEELKTLIKDVNGHALQNHYQDK